LWLSLAFGWFLEKGGFYFEGCSSRLYRIATQLSLHSMLRSIYSPFTLSMSLFVALMFHVHVLSIVHVPCPHSVLKHCALRLLAHYVRYWLYCYIVRFAHCIVYALVRSAHYRAYTCICLYCIRSPSCALFFVSFVALMMKTSVHSQSRMYDVWDLKVLVWCKKYPAVAGYFIMWGRFCSKLEMKKDLFQIKMGGLLAEKRRSMFSEIVDGHKRDKGCSWNGCHYFLKRRSFCELNIPE
jgi:hypothetical protein